MKRKKIFVLSIAALLTAGMVVGCGTEKDPSSITTSDDNQTSDVITSNDTTTSDTTVSITSDATSETSSEEESSKPSSADPTSEDISSETSTTSPSSEDVSSETSSESTSSSTSSETHEISVGYATADTAPVGWSYFNNPEFWGTGASATVEKAYVLDNELTFKYKYLANSDPAMEWGCQLLYNNDTLTDGQAYHLTFVLNSTAAGRIVVNGQAVNLVVGDNNIDLSVIEGTDGTNEIPSIDILFPVPLGNGEATIKISNLNWEKVANKLKKPEGIVYNASVNTLAWANDPLAASYVVYYYNEEGTEVASQPITNGGELTKTSELADGLYSIKLKALGDGVNSNDSDLSDAKYIVVGEYQEDQSRKDMTYATADTAPAGWSYFNNPEWWEGTSVIVSEAYSENGVAHFTYAYDEKSNPNGASAAWGGQLFFKDVLVQPAEYTLTMKINTNKAGKITVLGKEVTLVEGDNDIELNVTLGADATMTIVLPMSYGDGSASLQISDIKYTTPGSVVDPVDPVTVKNVNFTVVETLDVHWAKVTYETEADLSTRAYVKVNGTQFDCQNVEGEEKTLKIFLSNETGYPEKEYTVQFYNGEGKVFAQGTITIESTVTPDPDPVNPTKLGNVVGAVMNKIPEGYNFACAAVDGADKYTVEFRQNGEVIKSQDVTNGGVLTVISELEAGTYEVFVKAIDTTGAHLDSDYTNLPNLVIEGTVTPTPDPDPVNPTKLGNVVGAVMNKVPEGYVFACAPLDGADGFTVEFRQNGEVIKAQTVGNGGVITVISELGEGTYEVFVKAVDSTGAHLDSDYTPLPNLVIEGTVTPNPDEPTKLGNVVGAVMNKIPEGYNFACAAVDGADKYTVEFRQNGEVIKSQDVTNGGVLTVISELEAGTYEVFVKAIDTTGAHLDSDYTPLPNLVIEAA